MSKFIICGSSGFIGRNLAEMLIKEGIAQFVRLVDKRCPAIANMLEAQEELFDDESKYEFVQADLSRQAMVDKAISGDFQVVVNCAGESELGLKPEVYDERVVQVTEAVAKASAKIGAKFIQISDARIYKSAKSPCKEEATQKPWTKLAAAHLKAEQSLAKISGLNYTILRPSVVYGPGDRTGLMNRCVLAAIYKDNGNKMEMPFNANVKMSTVHVKDVAKAVVASVQTPSGSIFNVADPSNITLGDINALLEQVFSIKTGFVSGAMNMALKAASNLAAEVINDKHMTPWQELCKKKNIDQPILSPFMSPEVLIGDDLQIDGSKIVGVNGFAYKYAKPTAGLVLEMVNYFKKQGQFPK